MSIIGWIVLGLIAGFIANKIVEGTGQGRIVDAVEPREQPAGAED
jgi:uncharacterized membrane protein YeaQ/YmgE (transglycosylase-associated protein family)